VIPADVSMPLRFAGYLEGGTLAYLIRIGGHQIVVFSTANYIERELDGLRPDAAIVATGLRQEIHDYSCRLMRVLGAPALVATSHFDSWREPRPATLQLDEETRADLAGFADEIHACAPETRVVIPEYDQPINVP
jgi:hypothetical protein